MRLLMCSSTGGLSFTEDLMGDDEIPPYAILSHTWQHGQEVSFDDLLNGTGKGKLGYEKIQFCAEQARSDNLHHFWVDTCCINKKEHVELQDAINSMFRWYQDSAQCYVYLSDVSANDELPGPGWETAFRTSRWFTRGWTLQELLAPRDVKFFSREGKHLGNRRSLEHQIHEATGIAISALRAMPLTSFSVEERLSWSKGRKTTRKEDKVYSLLGLFGIYMLPNYGEGEEYAFKRFYREIDQSLRDPPWDKDLSLVTTHTNTAPCLLTLPRPQSFVGRKAQLAHIRKHILAEKSSPLAIYGLGGCGKTALALESAYWTKEQRPARAIFWVPAMSRESFEQAYYEIAKCLSLPGLQDAQVNVKRLVKARLSEEAFGHWLIIVDNADNTRVLLDDREVDRLIDYIPRSTKGSVIFTTRTRAAATQLAESNVIALEELQRAEAVEMLDRRLSHENRHQLRDSGTVDNFLDMLYCHALAIVQAVAFINTNRVTLFDYIELYRSSEMDAIDLLREEFDDQSRYEEASNSVATTWYISFEQIQKSNAIAAEHLFFVACTAANDIRASMYPPDYTKTEHFKAMGILKAYGFITERPQQSQDVLASMQKHNKTYDAHPLVHLAIRAWLKAHHQWILWLDTTLTRLVKIIPYGNYDTREYWMTYLHHAVYLASQPEVHEMEGRMTLLERVGGCERELGRFQAAEQTYRQAFEQRKKTSGEHHPDTLITEGNIGLVMGLQGRWAEAEKINREVYTHMKKVLGAKHPDTLTSNGNLALSVLGQGKYTEAEEMYREYLPLTRDLRGEKDPGTITAMHNLGAALRSLGNYVAAEKILRDTLQLSTIVLGPEDANTLSTLGVLGSMLLHQHKYAEAETTNRSTLALRQKVLGDSHPDTLTSMLSVGIALRGQSKLAEAAEIQTEALALSEKVSGKHSPHTLAHRGAWAQTLRAQGSYLEAEQIHRETLAVKEKVLGKMSVDTLMSVFWLAGLAHDQVQYEDALPLYERAYTGFLSVLGEEHPTTRECGDHYIWIARMVEEDKVREKEKAAREEEDRLEWEAREEELKPTSKFTLIDTRTQGTSEGGEKRRGKWRARLKEMVKKPVT